MNENWNGVTGFAREVFTKFLIFGVTNAVHLGGAVIGGVANAARNIGAAVSIANPIIYSAALLNCSADIARDALANLAIIKMAPTIIFSVTFISIALLNLAIASVCNLVGTIDGFEIFLI